MWTLKMPCIRRVWRHWCKISYIFICLIRMKNPQLMESPVSIWYSFGTLPKLNVWQISVISVITNRFLCFWIEYCSRIWFVIKRHLSTPKFRFSLIDSFIQVDLSFIKCHEVKLFWNASLSIFSDSIFSRPIRIPISAPLLVIAAKPFEGGVHCHLQKKGRKPG